MKSFPISYQWRIHGDAILYQIPIIWSKYAQTPSVLFSLDPGSVVGCENFGMLYKTTSTLKRFSRLLYGTIWQFLDKRYFNSIQINLLML